MGNRAVPGRPAKRIESVPVRTRILDAAFSAFMERGFAGTSTLDIATRAKVSKRELYAHFDSKVALLAAGITARARRMRAPMALPPASNREDFAEALRVFGATVLTEITSPTVVAVYRFAMLEAQRSPEVARTLSEHGRETNRRALAQMLKSAQSLGLLAPGAPREMAEQYYALLVGDLLLQLMLGIVKRPGTAEVRKRASAATDAFLTLHSAG
jgi:AcrR family transcriptional regulator